LFAAIWDSVSPRSMVCVFPLVAFDAGLFANAVPTAEIAFINKTSQKKWNELAPLITYLFTRKSS
jgi:hypothetical protein